MVTPPGADGKINPVILAAASVAGVDKIFKIGGAQAVAAEIAAEAARISGSFSVILQ